MTKPAFDHEALNILFIQLCMETWIYVYFTSMYEISISAVGGWGGRLDGGEGHRYTPNLYAKAHKFGGSISLG